MRRTIEIENKSDFDTRSIRRIVLAVARQRLKATELPKIQVKVSHAKGGFVTGKAVVGGSSITLHIPKTQTDVLEVINRVRVCFDYVKGSHGYSRGQEVYDTYERKGKASDYPFASRLTLDKARPTTKKRTVGAEAALQNAELAQERVHYWERKLKYATTMLKKWRRKLNYHASRGDKLAKQEAEAAQARQSMTAEEFAKLPPVGDS